MTEHPSNQRGIIQERAYKATEKNGQKYSYYLKNITSTTSTTGRRSLNSFSDLNNTITRERRSTVSSKRNHIYDMFFFYEWRNGDNILNRDGLTAVRNFEREIIKLKNFEKVCHTTNKHNDKLNSGTTGYSCVQLRSVSLFYFPSGSLPDGNGPLVEDDEIKQITRLIVSKQKNGNTMFEGDTSMLNPKSKIMRSSYYFGCPVAGFADCSDRENEQKQIIKNVLKDMVKLAQTHSNDKLNINILEGRILFPSVLNEYILHDALLAVGSVLFIAFYSWIHLESFLLMAFAMFNIIISLSTSLFFYRVCFNIEYFGAMNLLAVFVGLGIAVDDVYVLVNFYKQSANDPSIVQSKKQTEFSVEESITDSDSSENFDDDKINNNNNNNNNQQKTFLSRFSHTNENDKLIIKQRLNIAVKKGVKAMLLTTLTTCGAISTNIISPIPAINTFAIFMVLVVAINFVLVSTVMPCVIVIWSKYFEHKHWFRFVLSKCFTKITSKPTNNNGIELRWFERFLGGLYSTFCFSDLKRRGVVLGISLVLLIIAGVGVSFVKPDTKPPALSDASTNYQGSLDFIKTYKLPSGDFGCESCGKAISTGKGSGAPAGTPPSAKGNKTIPGKTIPGLTLPSVPFSVSTQSNKYNLTPNQNINVQFKINKPPTGDKCAFIIVCQGDYNSPEFLLSTFDSPIDSTNTFKHSFPSIRTNYSTHGFITTTTCSNIKTKMSKSEFLVLVCQPTHLQAKLNAEKIKSTFATATHISASPVKPNFLKASSTEVLINKTVTTPVKINFTYQVFSTIKNKKCAAVFLCNEGKVIDYAMNLKVDTNNTFSYDLNPAKLGDSAFYILRGYYDETVPTCPNINSNNIMNMTACAPVLSHKHRDVHIIKNDNNTFNSNGIEVRVIWGLSGYTGKEDIVFDANFDFTQPQTQLDLLKFCNNMKKSKVAQHGSIAIKCVIDEFKDYVEKVEKRSFPLQINQTVIFNKIVKQFLDKNKDIKHKIIYDNSTDQFKIGGVIMSAYSPIEISASTNEKVAAYRSWEKFMENQKSQIKTMQEVYVFQSSKSWIDAITEAGAISGVIWGIFLSSVIAICILYVLSGSIVMAGLGTLGLLFTITLVLGLLTACGWKIGIVEALALSILLGLSVDYLLHLIEGYMEEASEKNQVVAKSRFDATRLALQHIGISIVNSCFTTIGAVFFLFFADIVIIRKMGIIITVVIGFALLVCMLPFSALLAQFGPFPVKKHWKWNLLAFGIVVCLISLTIVVLIILEKTTNIEIVGPTGEILKFL